MSLLQPLTIEAIPRLNSFSSAYTGKIELEYYDVASSEFIAIENIKAHRIKYPPDHIPVFRFRSGIPIMSDQVEDFGGTLARGDRDLGPMCSMKHMFMEYRFLWPAHLNHTRKYMTAGWRTVSRECLAHRLPEGDDSWSILKGAL